MISFSDLFTPPLNLWRSQGAGWARVNYTPPLCDFTRDKIIKRWYYIWAFRKRHFTRPPHTVYVRITPEPTRSFRHDFLRAFRLLCGKLAAPCNTRLRSLIFFHLTHQQRKEGGASAVYAIFRNSVLKIKILFYVFCLSERVCVWFINIRKRLTFHIRTDRLGNKSFAIFSIENVDLVRKQQNN